MTSETIGIAYRLHAEKTLNGNEICTTLVFFLFPIQVDKVT